MNADSVIEATIKETLDALGITHTGIIQSDIAGQNVFSIQVEDGRALIGMRGESLQALDMLVKKIVERRVGNAERTSAPSSEAASGEGEGNTGPHFLVDVNEYRSKQIKDLQNKALMMAERARSFQYDVELSPMSSYERLIIHTALSDAPNVKTESQGEGRNRRVVIRYTQGDSAY